MQCCCLIGREKQVHSMGILLDCLKETREWPPEGPLLLAPCGAELAVEGRVEALLKKF